MKVAESMYFTFKVRIQKTNLKYMLSSTLRKNQHGGFLSRFGPLPFTSVIRTPLILPVSQ
uniref:Uncharacterized protein n=1 Tax=Anguilla anguilla TaxID=7936 RepID=A0A0E9W3F2_ANGAN